MRVAIQHTPEQLPLTHKNFEIEKLLPIDINFLLSNHILERNAIYILMDKMVNRERDNARAVLDKYC